jgi:hypothetical protein
MFKDFVYSTDKWSLPTTNTAEESDAIRISSFSIRLDRRYDTLPTPSERDTPGACLGRHRRTPAVRRNRSFDGIPQRRICDGENVFPTVQAPHENRLPQYAATRNDFGTGPSCKASKIWVTDRASQTGLCRTAGSMVALRRGLDRSRNNVVLAL